LEKIKEKFDSSELSAKSLEDVLGEDPNESLAKIDNENAISSYCNEIKAKIEQVREKEKQSQAKNLP